MNRAISPERFASPDHMYFNVLYSNITLSSCAFSSDNHYTSNRPLGLSTKKELEKELINKEAKRKKSQYLVGSQTTWSCSNDLIVLAEKPVLGRFAIEIPTLCSTYIHSKKK